MADSKRSHKYIRLRNRTKRQQLVTPSSSLISLIGDCSQPAASAPSTSAAAAPSTRKSFKMGKKVEKEKPPKERWLLTRKTWKYMTDAGRRLIPEYMQNRHHNSQDLKKIEEYFQEVCRNEQKFLPWRRKQSYPGAMGPSSFRRSGKLRSRWFARSSTGLAPISDAKSSGSSNVSSPTKANSPDGSEEDGGTANETQRMFLIIEMLEKYLKLSSTEGVAGGGDGEMSPENRDSYSPPAECSSTVTTPPHQTEPRLSDFSLQRSDDSDKQNSTSPPPYQRYRPADTERSEARRRFLFDTPTASAPSYGPSSTFHSRPSAAYVPRATGGAHTSLLLENLRSYGRSSRSSLLSSLNFTPAVLDDKQLLRRIRDELKQQQLDIILRRHSRRPFNTDGSNLRLSTSLFALPTLKSTTPYVPGDAGDYMGRRNESSGQQSPEPCTSPTARVPLISIKLASQEKFAPFSAEGTQTEPIPVNVIYQQYYEYMKRVEREQAEQQQQASPLSKSMSLGRKMSAGVTEKHSKRKSSIDNEDISQSVSDTIKRYLRMARKKPANDNNANQFKRINYDTNLRNIVPKAEIPKPDELDIDGNNKKTQTNDNWSEVVIQEIKMFMNNRDAPLNDCQLAELLQQATPATSSASSSATNLTPADKKLLFTSVSMPSSPTGFFHTSTQEIYLFSLSFEAIITWLSVSFTRIIYRNSISFISNAHFGSAHEKKRRNMSMHIWII